MKKTWKEQMYRLAFWVPVIFSTLALGCMALLFLPAILAKPLYSPWASRGLLYVFLIAAVLNTLLYPFCVAIRSYDKETFLRNKIRNLVFAESCISGSMFFMLLGIVVIIFSEEIEKMSGTVQAIIAGLLFIASVSISDMFSKHFKKKIVYKEDREPEKAKIISFEEARKSKVAHEHMISSHCKKKVVYKEDIKPERAKIISFEEARKSKITHEHMISNHCKKKGVK